MFGGDNAKDGDEKVKVDDGDFSEEEMEVDGEMMDTGVAVPEKVAEFEGDDDEVTLSMSEEIFSVI